MFTEKILNEKLYFLFSDISKIGKVFFDIPYCEKSTTVQL